MQTIVWGGETIFGALLGRKMVSTSTLGRATTAARGVSRSMKETEDVAKAQERVTLAQQELAALQQQIEAEATAVFLQNCGLDVPIAWNHGRQFPLKQHFPLKIGSNGDSRHADPRRR